MFAQVTTLLGNLVYCSAGAWVAGDADGKTVNLRCGIANGSYVD